MTVTAGRRTFARVAVVVLVSVLLATMTVLVDDPVKLWAMLAFSVGAGLLLGVLLYWALD